MSSVIFNFGQHLPEVFVVFLASYLVWSLGLCMLIMLWRRRMFARDLLTILSGGVLAYFINAVIHLLVYRPRPFISFGVEPFINTAHLAGSFPSDHAALVFALATGYIFLDKKNGWFFYALAIFVSLGRVLAGVHFLGDSIVGAIIGICAAYLVRQYGLFFSAGRTS
ncbi:hypothetical protein BK004_05020 [bacterium CG10_46_32]|nr:MAG: hypothetical protein BK004_05020 [bacterium CG10_46_32]